jgi:hypothetical protein
MMEHQLRPSGCLGRASSYIQREVFYFQYCSSAFERLKWAGWSGSL